MLHWMLVGTRRCNWTSSWLKSWCDIKTTRRLRQMLCGECKEEGKEERRPQAGGITRTEYNIRHSRLDVVPASQGENTNKIKFPKLLLFCTVFMLFCSFFHTVGETR
jgi:hypothetical protein